MHRQLRIMVVFAGMGAAGLLAAGCASENNTPQALTGQQQVAESSREIARWSDDKGHFHPEWREGINRPPGYPKPIPQ